MEKKKFSLRRGLGLLLTVVMLVLSLGTNAFAVTGSTVAADGTYSGYSSEGTVTVTVSNGKIANVSANVKSKYQSYISSAFSSVIGKAATANNIDAVSSSTKHMRAIVTGAKSAIQSAPAADGSDGGDDSGSGSGGGSGQTASQDEVTVEVGGSQELSVTNDAHYTYSWESADTSKVSVSGSGATATVNGIAVTESPVKVTCTYGLMGINTKKEYLITVVSAANEEIQSGVGEKTGTKYTGKAYVNNDEQDEWVELDVYVSDGKISGIFIAAEDGSWLNLLTTVKDNFLGLDATSASVDAVSSATTKGYRDTIRKAVSDALKDAEEETPVAPQLTSGDGSSYTKEGSSGLTFTSDADYSTFQSVKIDGTEIASKNYSVKSGSTVVTLNPDYLNTLGNGSHSIGIVSAAGTASGTFTVAAASGSGSDSSGGSGTSSGSYTGTAVSSLTDGDYIIAGRYRSYTDYYALGNSTAGDSGSGYAYAGIDVTIDGSTATVTDSAAVWTWDSTAGSFYNAASGKYLTLPSNKNSAGNFFSTSPVALTFYLISGNEATVYSPYGNGGYYLGAAYPSGGKAFGSQYARYINSSYLSSGSGVYFYKIESTQEQKAEITLDKSSVTLDLGASETVTATLTGCSKLAYTSSNSDIAEVAINGSSITVKGKAAGTTVLTFSAAPTDSYTAPDTVTLTVTVNKGSSGGGNTGGGTTTTTPGDPSYVKSISPENEVADKYTISLNVTADDLQSTTTTGGTAGKNGTNLVMVIDVSGSIVGKESDLNSAIRSLVNGLPENSQVGVVAFNESATAGQIFTKESISGLSFSGVKDAGTNMATGINAAASLLNGSGWNKRDNDKAMVIISDFDIDDYTDAINAAKTVKGGGAKVYSVNFGVNSIQEANKTELTSDDKVTANYNVTRYISSQYPSASATNPFFGGIGNGASVTPGNADTSATYVYGASGGNWSNIFAEIKASEGITEESTLPMTNVVISDTLSDYVELANSDSAAKYGVTLETTDTAVSIKGVTLSEDGKTVTVSLDGNLTDETAYTVKIPVKPSKKAFTETNQSSVAVQSYYSNTTAGMTYEYDADHTGTVTYKEKPTILVARQVTLTYDDNVADEEIAVPEAASAAVVTDESADNYNKAEFTIGNDPIREGYTFLGWNTDKGAAEGDSAYKAGSRVNLGANTTLYAIWQQKTKTFTLKYDKNAGDDEVTGLPEDATFTGSGDNHSFDVSDATPTREGYTFLGWATTVNAEIPDVDKTVNVTSTDENLTKTIYAVWSRKEYEVSYKVDGDIPEGYTWPASVKHPANEEVRVAEKATTNKSDKDGVPGTYTFEGWTTTSEGVKVEDGKFTMPAGNVEFTGTWTFTPDTYTVTWMNGSEKLEEDQTVEYQASPSYDGAEPTKNEAGHTYKFAGWGTKEDDNAPKAVNDLPKVTEDATYYALFTDTVNAHNVKYTVSGDVPTDYQVPADAEKEFGTTVEVEPVPSSIEGQKDGKNGTYTFEGWNTPDGLVITTGTDGKKTFSMPDNEVTITGTWKFTSKKHKVNFVNYDQSILQEDREVDDGETPVYEGEPPTKPEDDQNTYEFSGWKKVNRVEESSLTGLLDIFFMKAIAAEAPLTTGIVPVTEDTTYQAQFTTIPKGYTVTFNTDGGSEAPESQNVASNGTAKKPEKDPTKKGMIFDGWTLNGQPYNFDAPVTGDITLVAKWREAYKVTTEEEGHTYEIYQIFTGDLSSTTVGEGDDAENKDILTNLVWGENGTGTKGTAVDKETIKALKDVVGENLDTDKLKVIKKYVNTEGDPVQTITTDEGGTASIDLPAGYYLIRDVPNSQDGNDDATTTYITVIVKNYTVSPKSSKPSVKKEVDNDGTYGQTADYAIGDTATFKLTATLPADTNYAEYETYKVMFTDTMSEGLTFGEIKSVTVDGKEVTDATKYSTTEPDGGSWTLTIDDIKTAAADVNIVDGCEVIVTYTATLNEKAKATNKSGDYDKNGDVNTNSVKLSYSNDPYATGDGSLGQTTTEDYVWVFTYEVDNTKVNGDTNAALPGAGFRLYKGETEIKLSKDANGMYYPDASGNEEMISGQDGKFNIRGLDAGTYVLKETTVPGGYNKVDDTEITITATHAEAGENKATLDLGESAVNNTIKNFQGSELPTTGGIGTTIFYIVGGILVIGAGIILVTRRRMAD